MTLRCGRKLGALSAAFLLLLPVSGLEAARRPATGYGRATADSQCAARIRQLIADNPVRFARGSSTIEPASSALLDRVAGEMGRCPDSFLTITDSGEDECDGLANWRLSAARAHEVIDALLDRGVDRRRLREAGVAPGTTIPGSRYGRPCSSGEPTDPTRPDVTPPDVVPPHVNPSPSTPCPVCPPSEPWWKTWPGIALLLLLAANAAAAAFWLLAGRHRRRPGSAPVNGPTADRPRAERNAIGIPAAKGPPDDLTIIKGIGPQLNRLLMSLGVLRFDQIAEWTADDVECVDRHLEEFRGRILRDSWIEQAQLLARGAIAEFEQRFGVLRRDD